jgi:hypothetical protein
MNTGRRKALLGIACLALIWGAVWSWSNRAEISEAFEVATCRVPCLALTPEQLRLQVIKAYLHRQLDRNIERHDIGGDYQLALVPRDVTAQDQAQGITDATLLAILTTNATVLGSYAQIDALGVESFAHDPSIAVYSLNHRRAQIIPTRSIRKASATEIKEYFRTKRQTDEMPAFNFWQRWRGYGQHFFLINQYWEVSLACCDGRGDYSGYGLDWLNANSLRDITTSRSQLISVSDRGAILVRYYDGEALIFF